MHRTDLRVGRGSSVEPVPPAGNGELRAQCPARRGPLRLAPGQRAVADGQRGARRASRMAVAGRGHAARAGVGADGGLAVRVVRAGRRGDGVDRGEVRRTGAALASRLGLRVRCERAVARRLRPPEPRGDGAVVHEQGVGGDRRAADSRARVAPAGPRAGRAACAAVAARRGRLLRLSATPLRRRVPLLPGKLAARGAPQRRVARARARPSRMGRGRAAGTRRADRDGGVRRGARHVRGRRGRRRAREGARARRAGLRGDRGVRAVAAALARDRRPAKAAGCCSRSGRSR